jgi:hypothetical protein
VGGQPPVARIHEIGQHLTGVHVAHHGALGHLHLERLAALAVLVLAHAVHAVAADAVRVVAKSQERGHVAVGDQPDVAPSPAVATVGSAHGHGALATERHASGPTIAGFHVQLALIDELTHGTTSTLTLPIRNGVCR